MAMINQQSTALPRVFAVLSALILLFLISIASSAFGQNRPQDGAYPAKYLIQASDGNYYGCTYGGGGGFGTVFRINARGRYTVLHNFNRWEGANPSAITEGPDCDFYGVSYGDSSQGFADYGTVWKMDRFGNVTVLHRFNYSTVNDGQGPWDALVRGNDGNFYGTTGFGGQFYGSGIIFKISPSGDYTIMHYFSGFDTQHPESYDGAEPLAGLVLGNDGNFYGVTEYGGFYGRGTLFQMKPDGNVTILHSFYDRFYVADPANEGYWMNTRLIQAADGKFYGVAPKGGPESKGTAYRIDTQGNFQIINSEGEGIGLIQASDGKLYGTAHPVGTSGSVFSLTTTGTYTQLHAFHGPDGHEPEGIIQGSDGYFYGATEYGGPFYDPSLISTGPGVVYKMDANGNETLLHAFGTIFEIPVPSWAEGAMPKDSPPIDGAGPSVADYVHLFSGVLENSPGPDIAARNPIGPNPVYERTYTTAIAQQGYASPGLTSGWVDNYDFVIESMSQIGMWCSVTLIYPNGATETLTPELDAHNYPTGRFIPPAGAPYLCTAVLDDGGHWQEFTLTFKDRTRWTFTQSGGDPAGYSLSQITNMVGHYITIHRDGAHNNRLSNIVNDAGAALLNFGYHESGYLANVTEYSDPNHPRAVTYSYSDIADSTCLTSVSQIGTIENLNPDLWSYGYTLVNGWLLMNTVGVPDPTGAPGILSHTINYSSNGTVSFLVDANGVNRAYTYIGSQTRVDVIGPDGASVENWYQTFGVQNVDAGTVDGNGNSDYLTYEDPVNVYLPTIVTNRNLQASYFEYDPNGTVLSATDSRGVKTKFDFDYTAFALGQLTQVQDGQNLGSAKTPTKCLYYPNGMLQTVLSPMPGTSGANQYVATSYTYTALGNVATVTLPAPNNSGGTVTYSYNYVFDPLDNTTQSEALGEPLTVTDPMGHISHFRYDARGNLRSVIDSLGNVTDYQYDTADQLVRVTQPFVWQPSVWPGASPGRAYATYDYLYSGGPLKTTSIYDENGNLYRRVTESKGKEDEFLGIVGDAVPVQPDYTPQYRLNRVTDGRNNALQHTYDAAGNLRKIAYPLNNGAFDSIQGFPDADGNLIRRIDGRNRTTLYTRAFDDSRLTDITYRLRGLSAIHYDHDSYGRVIHRSDATGTEDYSYDDNDDVVRVTTTYTGLPPLTISYSYNPDGSRASMSTPAGTYTYTYDLSGRLTDIACPWSDGGLHYEYDDNDLLKSQRMKEVSNFYFYNGQGLYSLINDHDDGTHWNTSNYSLAATEYTGNTQRIVSRDAVDNLLEMWIAISGNDFVGVLHKMYYSYDSKDRLVGENRTKPEDWGLGYTYNFGYGSDLANNLTTLRNGALAVNADNQLTGNGFAFDGNGNPTTYQGVNLTYDDEDRLTGVAGILTAGYREDGLRAWKQNNQGVRTYFLYDGDTLACELDASGNVTAAYGFGAAGLAQIYYPQLPTPLHCSFSFDPFGNVVSRHWQNSAKGRDDVALYDAFGNLIVDYDAQTHNSYQPTDPVGYGGQWGNYTDRETGLVLMGHRYYDPGTGRFLTRDPIGYDGGINVYAYCENNPINHIDPMGLDDWEQYWNKMFAFGKGELKGMGNFVVSASFDLGANGLLGQFVPEHVKRPFHINHNSEDEENGSWFGEKLALVASFFTPAGKGKSAASEAVTASKGTKSYIIYVFENDGKVVYVGRTSRAGTPAQALAHRLSTHKQWHPESGDTARIIAVQGSKHANQGAEEVWLSYYQRLGNKLRNTDPATSNKPKKLNMAKLKVQAYAEDLKR
jgi:RHS repeat-associated protein